jgi:hypothetical protein
LRPLNSPAKGTKKSYTSTPSLAHLATWSPAADLEQIRAHKGAKRWKFPATKSSELGNIRSAARHLHFGQRFCDTSSPRHPWRECRVIRFEISPDPGEHKGGTTQSKGSRKSMLELCWSAPQYLPVHQRARSYGAGRVPHIQGPPGPTTPWPPPLDGAGPVLEVQSLSPVESVGH